MKEGKMHYQRELSRNYITFEPDVDLLRELQSIYTYDMGILEHNHIRGLLSPSIESSDGMLYMKYDISSMQPLERVLELKNIGMHEIKNIIQTLIFVCKEIKGYLLDENFILLDTKYIYTDTDMRQMYFFYIPNGEGRVLEGIQTLLEKLLSHVDKNDKKAVVAVYSLYQESHKENFILPDLEKYLIEMEEEKEVVYMEKRKDEVEAKEIKENIADIEVGKGVNPKEMKGFLKRIFKKKLSQNIVEKEEESSCDWLSYATFEDSLEKLQPQKEQEENFCTHTMLLQDISQCEAAYVLKNISDGVDIPMPYFPFIIGKQERICDYVLDTPGVSRLHIKFYKEGEQLMAADLNSRNGSKISDTLLENEECVCMSENDIVEIVGNKYILIKQNI